MYPHASFGGQVDHILHSRIAALFLCFWANSPWGPVCPLMLHWQASPSWCPHFCCDRGGQNFHLISGLLLGYPPEHLKAQLPRRPSHPPRLQFAHVSPEQPSFNEEKDPAWPKTLILLRAGQATDLARQTHAVKALASMRLVPFDRLPLGHKLIMTPLNW